MAEIAGVVIAGVALALDFINNLINWTSPKDHEKAIEEGIDQINQNLTTIISELKDIESSIDAARDAIIGNQISLALVEYLGQIANLCNKASSLNSSTSTADYARVSLEFENILAPLTSVYKIDFEENYFRNLAQDNVNNIDSYASLVAGSFAQYFFNAVNSIIASLANLKLVAYNLNLPYSDTLVNVEKFAKQYLTIGLGWVPPALGYVTSSVGKTVPISLKYGNDYCGITEGVPNPVGFYLAVGEKPALINKDYSITVVNTGAASLSLISTLNYSPNGVTFTYDVSTSASEFIIWYDNKQTAYKSYDFSVQVPLSSKLV